MHGDMRVAIIQEQQPAGVLTARLWQSNARNEGPQRTNSVHPRMRIYTQKCQWSTAFQRSAHNTKRVQTHKNTLHKTRDAFPDSWCMLCRTTVHQTCITHAQGSSALNRNSLQNCPITVARVSDCCWSKSGDQPC